MDERVSDDLVTWLRAQLDEDERAALRATAGPWRRGEEGEWDDEEAVLARRDDARPTCVAALGDFGDAQSAFDAEHITRWDPPSALVEVDTKRRILEAHEPYQSESQPGPACWTCGPGRPYPCLTVRLLTLPYAGRDGYREEWRQ